MFGPRSARSRAILGGVLLVALLTGVATLAVWRAHDDQRRHQALEHTSGAATALEHARAQFFLQAATTSALMFIQDPALAERSQLAAAELGQDLSKARAEMMASGSTDDLAALDDLTEQIDAIEAQIEAAMPFFLAGDQEAVLALASSQWPELWPTIEATMNDLETLAGAQESELASARAAADRAADITLWLLIGFSAAAFLVAAGTIAILVLSVVRPLTSLQASARAITSGDPEARANVFGPEEVASLAHAFNEMTDALSAKTQELEVRAITDSLTGLYSHAHFYQRLAEEIERSKRYGRGFAIVMMDVDNFKHYNDSRGHQAGDEALCLLGDCIRKAIRRSDIAFRYGGDEFAAILPHADSSKAGAVVDRINRRVTKSLKEMDGRGAARLSLSAGIACFPDDATTADDLVKIADAALYDAKRIAWARSVMERGQSIEPLASLPETLDEKQQRVLSAAADSLAAILQDVRVPDVLADLDLRTIAAVAAAAEIKDPYIWKHQERVSQWAAALAEEMSLPPDQVQEIRIAGLLHDLGKIGVCEYILNKPGKLTEEEFAEVKEHPVLGAMIVAHVEGFRRLVPIIRHHHERFDGKGYPDGLAGEEIPLEARILSVVDVFDALTHERSYRKALSREQAISKLERAAGTQFDPTVAKAFLALVKKPGDELAAPAQAASEDRQLAAARAAGRGKG